MHEQFFFKNNNQFCPVCLFTFNRFDELTLTIEALKSNYLAKETDLYIFSDGPRNDIDKKKVLEVRTYLQSITGFKNIFIKEHPENLGLANSIISGVSEVINIRGSVIILEDDLITSPNFLNFMNAALQFYKSDNAIISISGYTFDLSSVSKSGDFYFGLRSSSWGWATWGDRWSDIDWQIKDSDQNLKKPEFRKRLLRGGSDMIKMLNDQKKNRINSWAIRFCYHQAKSNLYTVFPSISKVKSIGFSYEATHTFNSKRFFSNLDDGVKIDFDFDYFDKIDKNIERDFRKKFSIWVRLKSKLSHIFKL
jgi:hypothetical protein